MVRKIIAFAVLSLLAVSAFGGELYLETLDSQKVSLNELVDSSPNVILFIWTSWCGYCREEISRLSDKCLFYDNVDIYFVNIGDSLPAVERFLKRQHIQECLKSKIRLDYEQNLARIYPITSIPVYLFFKDGEAVTMTHYVDQDVLDYVFGPAPKRAVN